MKSTLNLLVTIEHEGDIPSAPKLAQRVEGFLTTVVLSQSRPNPVRVPKVEVAIQSAFMSSLPWLRICQDCWQAKWPDQYVPELTSYGDCVGGCGSIAVLTVGVRQRDWTAK